MEKRLFLTHLNESSYEGEPGDSIHYIEDGVLNGQSSIALNKIGFAWYKSQDFFTLSADFYHIGDSKDDTTYADYGRHGILLRYSHIFHNLNPFSLSITDFINYLNEYLKDKPIVRFSHSGNWADVYFKYREYQDTMDVFVSQTFEIYAYVDNSGGYFTDPDNENGYFSKNNAIENELGIDTYFSSNMFRLFDFKESDLEYVSSYRWKEGGAMRFASEGFVYHGKAKKTTHGTKNCFIEPKGYYYRHFFNLSTKEYIQVEISFPQISNLENSQFLYSDLIKNKQNLTMKIIPLDEENKKYYQIFEFDSTKDKNFIFIGHRYPKTINKIRIRLILHTIYENYLFLTDRNLFYEFSILPSNY